MNVFMTKIKELSKTKKVTHTHLSMFLQDTYSISIFVFLGNGSMKVAWAVNTEQLTYMNDIMYEREDHKQQQC